MCGIVGAVGLALPPHVERTMRRATELLHHRGPDASGLHVEPNACFGHRRLSIIDTADRSNQPMISPSGDAVLVFNGEIYNYRELRAHLESHGERFTTTGDTEVLLRLLERDGPEALSRVAGMFALAFWRPSACELLLARDRFGEKPLFVAHLGGQMLFASELNALIEFPQVSRRLDAQSLGYFLETGYVPAPRTIYADVQSLLPGEWLVWRLGSTRRGRISEPEYRPDPALADDTAASAAVLDALRMAVRRQMISDVPLGAFLSGGIDSSSVVALMQELSSERVRTFNVRFEDATYDESPIARRVAEHLGTEHHEMTVTDSSFKDDDLTRIVRHVGQPFADSSAIPTYIVSRYARQHVTVALSGDGGDEMFAGYPAFQWAESVERLSKWPASALALAGSAAGAASRLPGLSRSGRLRQGRKALQMASLGDADQRFRALHWLNSPAEVERLLAPRVAGRALGRDGDVLRQLPPAAAGWTALRRRMYSRLRHELPDDMLVKVDRMSMAASLEVRAPFLNPAVAAVAERLPDEHLIRNGVGKHVLRTAMRSRLPAEVFDHRKWGFSIPLHRFVNARFREVAADLLRPAGPLDGLISNDAAQVVLTRGLGRAADAADYSVYQATHQLWALMQLAVWRDTVKPII